MLDPRSALLGFHQLIDAWRPKLTLLDELAGDGDFGDNMYDGMGRVARALDAADSPSSAEPSAFRLAANVFLDEVGGTSGPLFGLLFLNLADTTPLDAGVAAGLAAIQRVGGAQVGDRTLVDALGPAATALADAGLAAAAEAAVGGAVASADYRARLGRASYLGERAVGAPDPGAVAIALLFVALAASDPEVADVDLSALEARCPPAG
jgi:dihydroxyacetone kinase